MMKKGITYSVLSSSWDEDREGSGFGADEFQKNIGNIKEGLSRTKGERGLWYRWFYYTCIIPNSCHTIVCRKFLEENALLRERMAGLSENEIQRAIDDQERREKAKNKKDAWMEWRKVQPCNVSIKLSANISRNRFSRELLLSATKLSSTMTHDFVKRIFFFNLLLLPIGML